MMTRRTFTCSIAAAAAASVATAATKLKLGIGTYTYHSLSIDDMIVQLNRLNIDEIEMSRGEYMILPKKTPSPDLFKSTRAKLDSAGITCPSYYCATLRTDDELDLAVRFAHLLGAKNITGDATGDILDRIEKRLTAEGLTFGIHNHYFKQKFAYESPEDVLKALAGRSKTMGASLDTGHIASCGYDNVDAVRKLAPYLKMVHLKDVQASGGEVNVLLGKGIAKIPEAMAELKKANYTGLVAIEYEHDGSVEEDIRIEVEYARKLL
jgi:sugar phosphate isomerase/epimerase